MKQKPFQAIGLVFRYREFGWRFFDLVWRRSPLRCYETQHAQGCAVGRSRN